MIEVIVVGVNGKEKTVKVEDNGSLKLKAGETVKITAEGLEPYQFLQRGDDLVIETAQGTIIVPGFFAVTLETAEPMTVDIGLFSFSSDDPITAIWPAQQTPVSFFNQLIPPTLQQIDPLADSNQLRELLSRPAPNEQTDTNVTYNSIIGNLPPIVFNETFFIDEDNVLFANLLANDFDPDGHSIAIFASFVTPTGGVPVPLNSDGNFSFDPTTSLFFQSLPGGGLFTFQINYIVGDGFGGFTSGLATINVLGVNDAPIATDNMYTVLENMSVGGNLITDDTGDGVDSDVDIPSTLSVTAVVPDSGTLGSVSFTSDGSFTYFQGTLFDSLAMGATHEETFTYTLTDDMGATDTATLKITITGVNDAPVATDNSYTVLENASTAGNLITDDTGSGTDFDVDIPSTIGVTAVMPDAGTLGSVSYSSDGSFTYDQGTLFDSLAMGATYSETFTYTLTDDLGATDTATLTITITGVNDAPVATDNSYTVLENETTGGNLISDDTGSGTDFDVDIPSTIGVTAVTPDAGTLGSVSFTSDGSFTYTQGTLFDSLAMGATHIETFTYTLTDDLGATDTATLTITITGVNDAPVATDNGYSVLENETTGGNLISDDTGSGTDFDVDIPSTIGLTVVTPDAGTLGSVSFSSDGSFTYDQGTLFDSLAMGATHVETFTYTLTDDLGATDTATLTITITGVNDAPVATDNSYTVVENATTGGNLITDDTGAGTDSDVDVPSTIGVTAVAADAGTLGSVSFTSDGSFTYAQGTLFDSLAAGATHLETFTYTLTDDLGATDTATLTITITGVNDAPVATDNSYTVLENASTAGNLITDDTGSGTDFDVDIPSTIGVTAVTPDAGTLGSVSFSSDGSFTYDQGILFDSLAMGATYSETFTYTLTDDLGATDTATLTITITGVNDAPVATDNSYTVAENATTGGNLITDDTGAGTDSDVDIPSTLSVTAVTPDAGTLGSVSFTSDGSFTYAQGTLFDSLAAGATHSETFTYTLTDDLGATDTATLTITITGVNDAPVATDNSYSILENETTGGNLISDDTGSGSDFDVDIPSTIGVTAITPDAGTVGSVSFSSDGSFTYDQGTLFDSLAMGATYAETFTYTLTDDMGATDTATLTITIIGVNDAPVATDNMYMDDEDATALTGNVITDDTGSGVDSDVDVPSSLSIPASAIVVTTSGGVTLTLGSDGTFTYPLDTAVMNTLGATETFTDSFIYTVSDDLGATDSATVTLTVKGVNDAPVAVGNAYIALENSSVSGNVITDDTGVGTDSDVDANDTLSIPASATTVTTSLGVTMTLGSDGSFTYVPGTALDSLSATAIVIDSFTYTITDGLATDSAAVFITVLGENDAPVATDNSYTVLENETTGGNLISDDTGSGTDFDVDIPSTISVTAVTPDAGTVGSVSFSSDGSFTYAQGTLFDSLAVGATHAETFTYTLTDDQGATDTATLTMTITGVNDAPVATDNSYTVAENATTNGNLITDDTGSGIDSDVDVPSTLSVTAVTPDQGTLGSVSFSSDGSFTYAQGTLFDSLAVGATHAETFTYTLTDDQGATDTATLTITITGVNDAPVATDNGYSVLENETTGGNLISDDTGSGIDSDIDIPSTLSVTAVTPDQGTLGSVSFSSDGSFTYDQGTLFDSLGVGATHAETFTYTLTDDQGATDTATLTMTITGVNDAPVATNNSYTVAENATTSGNLITDDTGSGVDSDVDVPSTLSVTAVTSDQGTLGSISFTSDGSFTYDQGTLFDSLAVGATHAETFTYTLTDDQGATDTATLTITITGVNDAPVATDNAYTVLENATLGGNLFTDDSGSGTDFDVDVPSTFTVTGLALGSGFTGLLGVSAGSGEFAYIQGTVFDSLAAGATTSVDFTYTITDDIGATDSAVVTITIIGVNDAPVATDNSYTVAENATTGGNLITDDTGVGIDSDVDIPSTLSVTAVTPDAGTLGSVSFTSDGSFTYAQGTLFDSLAAGATHSETFTYTLTDDMGATDTATLTMTITGVNDAPVATDNSYTVAENATTSGNLITDDTSSGVDSDVDVPSTLSVTAVTPDQGTLGSVSFSSDGSFTYAQGTLFDSLAVGATHAETFTYTLTDDQGATDTATLTMTITGVNDAPVATDNGYTVAENGTVAGNLITDDTGSGTDSDIDIPSTISVTAVTPDQVALGSISFSSDGSFTYDQGTLFDSLAMGATHAETFTYTLTDDQGATDTATLTITITGVNDAPVATDNGYSVLENATTGGNLITDDTGAGTDSDVDLPSTLSITAVTPDAGTLGSVSFTSDGSFTYAQGTLFDSLAVGATHAETFTYTLTDDQGATDTATLTMTITGVNDAPVATDNGYTVAENATVAGNLITDDTGAGTDSDVDVPATLSVTAVTPEQGTLGSVSFSSDGSFTYDQGTLFDSLAVGATHAETFTYTLTDDQGATDTATLTITITGENDAPVARPNAYTTLENTSVGGNVITDDTGAGVDSDIDVGDTLSIPASGLVVTSSSGVTVSLTSAGAFTYAQGTAFDSLAAGTPLVDSFVYTITDGTATATAAVFITVIGENDAPVATDNAYTTTENANVSGNVITDDSGSGVDSDVDVPSTISISGGTQTIATTGGGVVCMASDGSFTYGPGTNFDSLAAGVTATDSFSYTITDDMGATDTATVIITLTGENDPPTAVDDDFTHTEGLPPLVGNVFADNGNGTDFDIDGDAFSVTNTGTLLTTLGGLVTLSASGGMSFSNNGVFNSLGDGETIADTFIYTISDGVFTDSATVTVVVTGVNDAPTAVDNAYSTIESVTVGGNVITDDSGSGVDSDPDTNDILSIDGGAQTVATSGGGVVSLASDGSFTYDPGTNYDSLAAGSTDTDSFSYTITDGIATSSANVTITVTGANNAPVATDNAYSGDRR